MQPFWFTYFDILHTYTLILHTIMRIAIIPWKNADIMVIGKFN